MANMACVLLTLSLCLAAAGAPPEARPYIAVIEKVAGAVGFYDENGGHLGQVKVGSFPHEAVLSRDGRLL